MNSYLDHIEASGIKWLHGYPSFLNHLAVLALSVGRPLQLEHVTTGAENLLPHQTETIRKAFRTEPTDHYGMEEGVANFSRCEAGTFHVDEDYSFVEFLNHPSDSKNVVGTNFTNLAFPLIRYEVGDLARVSSACPASDCEVSGRVVDSIEGRSGDSVVCSDGSIVTQAALSLIFKVSSNIQESQIVQPEPGHAEFKIVKTPSFTRKDEAALTDAIDKHFDKKLEYRISYVDEISRAANGKLKLVISEFS